MQLVLYGLAVADRFFGADSPGHCAHCSMFCADGSGWPLLSFAAQADALVDDFSVYHRVLIAHTTTVLIIMLPTFTVTDNNRLAGIVSGALIEVMIVDHHIAVAPVKITEVKVRSYCDPRAPEYIY